MTRSFITVLFCLTISACGQTNKSERINGLTISPGIKTEAEKHFKHSKELDVFKEEMEICLNSGDIQSYEGDSLVLQSTMGENNVPFKSFYYWHGDTLSIDGAFGLFGGIGFGIEIVNRKAVLYHMLSSDDFPTYAYTATDSLQARLEVPCTDTKIILSGIPDTTGNQIIYGYIEFKSKDFYVNNNSEEGQERVPRQKMRNNMKLYFKSRRLTFNQ